MMVRAHLADGSVIEGDLGGWSDGVIEIDGRRWDGLLFFEPITDDEDGEVQS